MFYTYVFVVIQQYCIVVAFLLAEFENVYENVSHVP